MVIDDICVVVILLGSYERRMCMKKTALALCLMVFVSLPVVGNAIEFTSLDATTISTQDKRLPSDIFSIGKKETSSFRAVHGMSGEEVELYLGQPDEKKVLDVREFKMRITTYQYGNHLDVFFRGSIQNPSNMRMVGFEIKDNVYALPREITVGSNIQEAFAIYGEAKYNEVHNFYYYEQEPSGVITTAFYVDQEGKIVKNYQGTEL